MVATLFRFGKKIFLMYKITGTNKASFEKVRSGVKYWG